MTTTWTIDINHISDSGHPARVCYERCEQSPLSMSGRLQLHKVEVSPSPSVCCVLLALYIEKESMWRGSEIGVCLESRIVRRIIFLFMQVLMYERQRLVLGCDL